MLVNIVNIPTPHGWRSIELREGDITQPDATAPPDVLVVSSFNPTSRTRGEKRLFSGGLLM
jgi:hypothetical protein